MNEYGLVAAELLKLYVKKDEDLRPDNLLQSLRPFLMDCYVSLNGLLCLKKKFAVA